MFVCGELRMRRALLLEMAAGCEPYYSLGNRRLSRAQFLAMWETRDDAVLKGRLLAVLPLTSSVATSDDFFTNIPGRPAEAAVRLQAVRRIP